MIDFADEEAIARKDFADDIQIRHHGLNRLTWQWRQVSWRRRFRHVDWPVGFTAGRAWSRALMAWCGITYDGDVRLEALHLSRVNINADQVRRSDDDGVVLHVVLGPAHVRKFEARTDAEQDVDLWE